MNVDLRILLLTVAFVGQAALADPPPSFNRDIRPLLASKCFSCHGPDESHREAELRLDQRDSAVDAGAITPGRPGESELVARIFHEDPDVRMPPADSGESLTDAEKELLKQWIAAGAEYEPHWAFVSPKRPDLPKVTKADWPRNGIDHFVLARLEGEGLPPSPEADRYALVRRVYLDLIGLPPTPEEADAFVRDEDPQAYDKLVDRLLRSPRYGEHWARQWLDLARYADTNGYEKDRPRSIWPYRDWVIQALNDDMPYDRFTIEQLAGDMLPDATPRQRIATGFHRNTMLNEEGGIDPLEYRFYAMVDRVATSGTVWLGLTTGCAQCHTHKYDPITHTDYYRLMALLDNADEPEIAVLEEAAESRRQQLTAEINEIEAAMLARLRGDDELQRKFDAWRREASAKAHNWAIVRPTEMEAGLSRLVVQDDGSIFASGDATKRDVYTLRFPLDTIERPLTALRLEALPDERLPASGPGRAFYEGRKGDFFLSEITATVDGKPVALADASHTFGKISIGSGNAKAGNVIDGNGSTGWSTATREGEAHQLVLNLKEPLAIEGHLELALVFERHFAASLGRFRLAVTSDEGPIQASQLPVEVERLLAENNDKLNERQLTAIQAHYCTTAPAFKKEQQRIAALRKQLPNPPMTLVMQERPADHPRPTYRRHRGEYLNQKEQVTAGLPGFLVGEGSQPTNRLEFARWLVSDENPLAARVAVNRAWQSFFGRGLVASSGDFGTQAAPPTHPQLLDWLAIEFVARGWSTKELHRLIVTSSTYRQSSHVSPELLRRDPDNLLLARGPRHRVAGETVRDIMLAASGLLSKKMHGSSVYPPQPASVAAVAYGNTKWNASQGEDRYRRSLYTFKKRTAPFAAYITFDGNSGESCVVRRNRSNTPLQALTLLNDEMYLEMGRALARKAMELGDADDRDRAAFIFRRVLTRPPDDEEVDMLLAYRDRQLTRLKSNELNAAEIAGDKNASANHAAWVLVARLVMNLDEAIVKP